MAKKRHTYYYGSRDEISKNLFHKASAYGTEPTKIPMTTRMQVISILDLFLQGLLLGLCIVFIVKTEVIPALVYSGFYSSWMYLLFAGISLFVCIAFRVGLRVIPLEMWRLSARVRLGVIKSQGTLLKWISLLVELATVLCFIYIVVALYLGGTPHIAVLIAWAAALFLVIFFPCRAAVKLAEADRLH